MTGATRQTVAPELPLLSPSRHHNLRPISLAREDAMSADDDSSGWQLTESDPGVFTYVVKFNPEER